MNEVAKTDVPMETKDELRPDTTSRLLDQSKPPPTATCPKDGDPLVCTFLFRGAEFVCLECGTAYGWLAPTAVETTPELEERTKAREAEWEELSKGAIASGIHLHECEACRDEPHLVHASEDEKARSAEAYARIKERFGK